MTKRLLIDANNIGFAAHQATKLRAGGRETQAIYGTMRMIRDILLKRPGYRPLCLWDGRSWRHSVFAEYKANRDQNAKRKAQRDAYKAQRKDIVRGLALLGMPQLTIGNMEADDLAGMIVRKNAGRDEIVMISGDGDWLQLVGPNVAWFDPVREYFCDESTFEEFTGYVSPIAFLQGKALVGDTGDNIPGVPGIGEKAAPLILEEFGSVSMLLNQHQQDGFELPQSLSRYRKKIADFAEPGSEGRRIFKKALSLMALKKCPCRPPVQDQRKIHKPLNREKFEDFCHEFAFKSILRDFDKFLAPFERAQKGE